MATNTAPVKWAQRKDSLYITIALADVKDEQITLTDKTLTFTGTSGDKKYNLNLVFYKDIVAEGSIWKVLPSSVQMKLNKLNPAEEFWPRLLLDKAQEKTNVSIDWNKYVDEDEAEGADFNMDDLSGGMDFGAMGGGSGFGGPGGQFEDDSDDDEELPDLEPTSGEEGPTSSEEVLPPPSSDDNTDKSAD